MTVGYFANGTEGSIYKERYCRRCIHYGPENCPVWFAHLLHNYDECNKDDSILHLLIPLTSDGLGNEQCLMFIERDREKA